MSIHTMKHARLCRLARSSTLNALLQKASNVFCQGFGANSEFVYVHWLMELEVMWVHNFDGRKL
jgi:hypothetical protein